MGNTNALLATPVKPMDHENDSDLDFSYDGDDIMSEDNYCCYVDAADRALEQPVSLSHKVKVPPLSFHSLSSLTSHVSSVQIHSPIVCSIDLDEQ
jgi:hypothetical protein